MLTKCAYCKMLNQHIEYLKCDLEKCQSENKVAILLELKSYYWIVDTYTNICLKNCKCKYKNLFIDTLLQLKEVFKFHQIELDTKKKHCDICKILPCELFALLDIACLLSNDKGINSICIELQYHIFLSYIYSEYIGKCENCDNYVEYNACLKSAVEFIASKNINNLRKFVYFWKIARNNDEIMTYANDIDPIREESSRINIIKQKMIYLDFNVYEQYEKNLYVKCFFDNLCAKSKINIVCSSTHIEEILRMNSKSYEQKRIYTISSLTKGKIILVDEKGHMDICIDDLEKRLKYIEKYNTINQLAEQRECINAEARDYIFSYKRNNKRDSAIGSSSLIQLLSNTKENISEDDSFELPNKNELNQVFKYISNGDYCIEDYQNKFKLDNINFIEIYSAIVAFARLFNIIGLHGDKIENKTHPNAIYPMYGKKSYKKIRSGYYDNEHLSFATKCTYFVTCDKKLYDKAKEIYSYLGVETIPIMLDDFIKTDIK